MKIKTIRLKCEGRIRSRSSFYTAQNIISEHDEYVFVNGINSLSGDIDSGTWGVSYLLSLYPYRSKDFCLFRQPELTVNGEAVSLKDFAKYSCYLDDKLYPLFSGNHPAKSIIQKALKKRGSDKTAEDIRALFQLTPERFGRPLKAMGNEKIRAMAAVG